MARSGLPHGLRSASELGVFDRRLFLGASTAASAVVLAQDASAESPRQRTDALSSLHTGTVNAVHFGVIGDGVADDTKAIQAAIDHALEAHIPHVTLPPGRFRTTDTIHLGYGEVFRTLVLQGAGGLPYRGEMAGSVLVPENTRKPVLNIQGGRGSAVYNIGIVGRNFDWIRERTKRLVECGESDPQRWVDPSLDNALSRYSPYAAITVDAFSGPRRFDGDFGDPPRVPYVSDWRDPGPRLFSSNIVIDRCWLGGFGVGIAVQPCDADGNGDFVRVANCSIENCVYGIAVGNSQSRNVAVRDCVYARVHTFVTNKAIGRGIGTLGGVFDNVSGGSSFQFMDLVAARSLPISIISLYFESQSRIGTWSNNSQMNNSIVFQTCTFKLSEGLSGIAGNSLLECGKLGSVRFSSCTFHHARRIYNVVRGASQVTLEDCLIGPVSDFRDDQFFRKIPSYVAKALEYTCGGAFIHSDAMGARARIAGGGLGLSFAGKKAEMQPCGETLVAIPGRRQRVHHYARIFLDRYGITWRIRHKREPFALSKQPGKGLLKRLERISGDRIALVLSERIQARLESHVSLGDIIFDYEGGIVFTVSDIVIEGGDCRLTALQLNDFKVINGNVVPNKSHIGTGGSLWFYRCSTMIGDAVFFGDYTAGSTVVRNVHCGNGDRGGVQLAVESGDFLYEGRSGIGAASAHYSAMTRVVLVAPAAGEVHIDKPAKSTGRGLVSTVCLD